MNIEKSVSVIIPYYNRHETIQAAIESVLSQTLQPTEIIVVDDGSSSESLRFLKNEYGGQTNLKIISQTNGGVSSARNTGLMKATGQFVAFLDSDDLWITTHLEKSIGLLNRFPEVIVTHSKFEYKFSGCNENQALINRLATRLAPWKSESSIKDVAENYYILRQDIASELLIKAKVKFSTSSIVINIKKMKSRVFFDIALPFAEDVDFISALILQGSVGYVDHLSSYYRIHENNTVSINSNLTHDKENIRIAKLRSMEKRIIYSGTPSLKIDVFTELSHRYYLIAQSLSDKKNYKRALEWYLLSFKLKANKASFKHIFVQKILPDFFANRLYKE
jgi:glycosyltransferase involved in cell wall biosynthesis